MVGLLEAEFVCSSFIIIISLGYNLFETAAGLNSTVYASAP